MKDKEKMKRMGVFLTLIVIGFALSACTAWLLNNFFPTFGKFWETAAITTVMAVAAATVSWWLLGRKSNEKRRWIVECRNTLIYFFAGYFALLVLGWIFNDPIEESSRLFLRIIPFCFVIGKYEELKNLSTSKPADDLYTQATEEMKQEKNHQ